MTGLACQLLVSWLLLWLYEKNNLSPLGLRPTNPRLLEFTAGFFAFAAFCTLYHFGVSFASENPYRLNESFGLGMFAEGFWYTLKSVIYEELLFRGALFYILIKKIGFKYAGLLSAAAFGIYHWFTYGALGDPIQMCIVFVMTASWGWMFGYAYAKTGSLYLPIGLHFGRNLVNIVLFSKGPLGTQLLISSNENRLQGLISLFVFVLPIVVPPLLVYVPLRKNQLLKTKKP